MGTRVYLPNQASWLIVQATGKGECELVELEALLGVTHVPEKLLEQLTKVVRSEVIIVMLPTSIITNQPNHPHQC